jgi:putative FmdB family regulatory protein
MPTYDYHCENCGHQLEAFQKITDEPLKECPHCHKNTLRRGPGGGIGLSFTGTGWYKTDYANPQSPKGSSSDTSPKKECCPCGKGSCST